jgi:hypothetical protein
LLEPLYDTGIRKDPDLNISLRRKLLVALAGSAAAYPILSFGHVHGPLARARPVAEAAGGAGDTLLAQARIWIDGLRQQDQMYVPYPISQLQRTLRIGYARTRGLVELLAQHGEWTIGYRPEGGPFARIRPKEDA